MNTTMNLAILTLALSGCVAQPQQSYQPAPATTQVSSEGQAYLVCAENERRTQNFMATASLIMDKCFAGDKDFCLNGAKYIEKAENMLDPDLDLLSACLKTGFYAGRPVALNNIAAQNEKFLEKLGKYRAILNRALKKGHF